MSERVYGNITIENNGSINFTDTSTGQVSIKAPSTAGGSFTLTLPAITDTLVGKTTTDTLTNKTLTSPTVTGESSTAIVSLGLRDTSAAFDVTLAATSSTTLTAGRTLTVDMQNSAQTIKISPLNKFSTLTDGSSGQVLSTLGSGTGYSWVTAATNTLNQFNILIGNSSNTATSTNTNLIGDLIGSTNSANVTISIASPGVVSWSGHGLVTGQKIYLTTTGALPTGLSVNTTYYVIFASINTFQLAANFANALSSTSINTSGTQSGTHTAFAGGLQLADTALLGNFYVQQTSSAVTINTSGTLVTWTGHGLSTGATVYFTGVGTPTGMNFSTTYYVVPVNANSFNVSTTLAQAVAGSPLLSVGSSGSSVVGHAGGVTLNSNGLPGIISGVAIPAGSIGEMISATSLSSQFSETTPALSTYFDVTNYSITLSPGVWRIVCQATFEIVWSSGTSSVAESVAAIRSGSSTIVQSMGLCVVGDHANSPFCSALGYAPISLITDVNISTSTTYKLSVLAKANAGTPVISNMFIRGDEFPGAFYAVRIA